MGSEPLPRTRQTREKGFRAKPASNRGEPGFHPRPRKLEKWLEYSFLLLSVFLLGVVWLPSYSLGVEFGSSSLRDLLGRLNTQLVSQHLSLSQ
jgi:hypothetical protein